MPTLTQVTVTLSVGLPAPAIHDESTRIAMSLLTYRPDMIHNLRTEADGIDGVIKIEMTIDEANPDLATSLAATILRAHTDWPVIDTTTRPIPEKREAPRTPPRKDSEIVDTYAGSGPEVR